MLNSITLGKIVKAASQAEAKDLFANRYKQGIGGVIFTPEFNIPKWTDSEKIRLADFYCEIDADEEDDHRHDGVADWLKISQNITKDLFELSKDFNRSSNPRSLRFVYNNTFDFKPHCDLGAMDGWVHLHISGAGMRCANPIGTDPVKVKKTGAFGDNLDVDDFSRLLEIDKKIEIVTLEEGQAIAFDHTMAHQSGQGQRFRIPIFAR